MKVGDLILDVPKVICNAHNSHGSRWLGRAKALNRRELQRRTKYGLINIEGSIKVGDKVFMAASTDPVLRYVWFYYF